MRKQQAKTILTIPNTITQTNTATFKVKSSTNSDKEYTVSLTGNGLTCICPDHQFHKSYCKHIHAILNIIKQNRGFANNEFKIMERTKLNISKYCSSSNIIKKGMRKNKHGNTQKYK